MMSFAPDCCPHSSRKCRRRPTQALRWRPASRLDGWRHNPRCCQQGIRYACRRPNRRAVRQPAFCSWLRAHRNALPCGDEVQIKAGLQTLRGTITRVEPVAAALPREFQRSFAPVETQQLIRVEFAPGEAPPPLFTKVNLRSDQIIPRWVSAFGENNNLRRSP